MSRRHNDANVLCLPADLVGDALMQGIVRIWISTEFEGGRHARRVGKIVSYEHAHQRDGMLDDTPTQPCCKDPATAADDTPA